MPIVVSHQPAASAVANAGAAGGYASYQRWLYELMMQRAQQERQAQIAIRGQDLDRMNAIQQAAMIQGNRYMDRQFDVQRAQQDHANRLQALQVGAGIEAAQLQQRGALAEDSDARRMERESSLLERRLATAEAMRLAASERQERMREVEDRWRKFSDPFSDYAQQQQAWQQQGLSYTPDQQQELQDVQAKIRRVKSEYTSGRLTRPDALSAMMPLHDRMWSIEPTQRSPSFQEEVQKQRWFEMSPRGVEILWEKDGKTGAPRATPLKSDGGVEGSPGTGGKGALAEAKIGGEMFKANAAQLEKKGKWIAEQMMQLDAGVPGTNAMGQPVMMPLDPQTRMIREQTIRQEAEKMYPGALFMNPQTGRHEWNLPDGGRETPRPGAAAGEAVGTAAPPQPTGQGPQQQQGQPAGGVAPPPPDQAVQQLQAMLPALKSDPAKHDAAFMLMTIFKRYGTDPRQWSRDVYEAATRLKMQLKGAM